MATTRNTGKIIEPWSGSGWPLHLFVDQKALTEKGIYFCSRTDCGQKNGRILREPWQLTCGHRLCKECFDFIQSLPGDQRQCDGCKNEPLNDVVSTDHMDVDRQAWNGDADVDKQPRFDAVQLIETEEQQRQQQEQQLEPRFCKIDSMKAKKDNAANRELNRMLIKCPYDCGTSSKLTVRTIDKHMNTCEQRLVPCEKCAEVIRYSQKSEHAANTCPFRPADCPNNCNKSGLRGKDLPKHMLECEKKPLVCNISKHPYAFNEKPGDHMVRCVAKCPLGCTESAEVKIIEHLSAEHLVEKHLQHLLQMFSKADSMLKTQGPSSGAGVALTQITSMLERLLQLESKSDKTQRMLVDKVSQMTQESASGLTQESASGLLTKARVSEKNRSDLDDLEALFKVLAQDVHLLKRCLNLVEKEIEIEDQKSALNDMQMPSFNGRLIWRIDRVQQRRDEFRSKPFILSHAFFTKVYGFKMCAKLYLNGDGTGVNTHISLYFVVMKGEYDALLHWSFQQKVTLKLKNQTRKVDVSKSFRPDPTSPCFEKPKSDKNLASGCPQFAEQAYVFSPQNGFVVDNTMFIEISVDSSYEAQKGLNTSVQENGESYSPPGRNQPKAHRGICIERLVRCEKCAEGIRCSQKSEHDANICSYRPVDCPNNCGKEGLTANELTEHLVECKELPLVFLVCSCGYQSNDNYGVLDHLLRCVGKFALYSSERPSSSSFQLADLIHAFSKMDGFMPDGTRVIQMSLDRSYEARHADDADPEQESSYQ